MDEVNGEGHRWRDPALRARRRSPGGAQQRSRRNFGGPDVTGDEPDRILSTQTLSTSTGILERQACLGLLASATVGRISYTEKGLPTIHPAHYVVEGGTILTRSPTGSALTSGGSHVVTFQVDHLDHTAQPGWSIVVTGHAQTVTHLASLRAAPLPSWIVPEYASRLLSIESTLVSGRAFAARR